MSNKLKKTIKCCLCDKTVPFTEDCQKLFEKFDVCPACTERLARFVNQSLDKDGIGGDDKQED